MNETSESLLSDDAALAALFASQRKPPPIAPVSALTGGPPSGPPTAPARRGLDPVMLGMVGGEGIYAAQPQDTPGPGGSGGVSASGAPGPFEPIAPLDPANGVFRLNPASRLYAALGSTQPQEIDGLGEDISIQAGTQVWLQIDTSDGISVSGASVESGINPPYVGDGNLVTYTQTTDNTITTDTWDQSFLPLVEVYAYDAAVGPQHGGVVMSNATTSYEVVRLVHRHLALTRIHSNGVAALFPL